MAKMATLHFSNLHLRRLMCTNVALRSLRLRQINAYKCCSTLESMDVLQWSVVRHLLVDAYARLWIGDPYVKQSSLVSVPFFSATWMVTRQDGIMNWTQWTPFSVVCRMSCAQRFISEQVLSSSCRSPYAVYRD